MLEYIRSNAQSFGVKLAFGVIILVFVFWGIGSLRDTGSVGVVARVNGEPIAAQDYYLARQRAEDSLRQRNPGITREQFKQMQLGQQVLRQLVLESLLDQEAKRIQLAVSPLELRNYIVRLPVFHNEQGAFDAEVYKRVLAAQRTTPGRFEDQISRSLLEDKLRQGVASGAYVSPEEARALFDFTREQRAVDYVFFPADPKADAVQPGEDEVKAWYESHRESFAVPARVDVEYILARPGDLARPDQIAEADVAAWYEKNRSDYAAPAQVRARHILLRLDPKAPDSAVQAAKARADALEADLRRGADFAALAAKASEDAGSAPNGGDLGWVKKGDTVPPFEAAAFALKAGEISAPVRSDFGFHIIKAEERKEAVVRPLAEVSADIRKRLALIQGGDRLREALDNLIEANILGKPLAEAAAPYQLTAQRTGPVSAAELRQRFGLKDKAAETLVTTPAGASVDAALEAADDGFMIARVAAATPAGTRDLAAVREEIVATLRREKALKIALENAGAARAAMVNDALPAALKDKARSTPLTYRGEDFPGLGKTPGLGDAIFAAPAGQWLPSAFAATVGDAEGAVLVRVKDVAHPDDAQWTPLAEMLRGSLEDSRKQELYQVFVQLLSAKAKVELLNPSILEESGR